MKFARETAHPKLIHMSGKRPLLIVAGQILPDGDLFTSRRSSLESGAIASRFRPAVVETAAENIQLRTELLKNGLLRRMMHVC